MRRTGLSAFALPSSVLVATIWVAVSCSLGGSAPTPTASTAQISATPSTSTLGATLAVPTTEASSASQAPVSGSSASLDPSVPPPGLLSAGGTPVQGSLGTYCWHANGVASCVDSVGFTDSGPDLPVLALASAGAQLQFSLGGAYPFETWSASYVNDNGDVVPLGAGASFDPDQAGPTPVPTSEAIFPAPPTGQSIVQLFVRFADGGDASYGWNVTVP